MYVCSRVGLARADFCLKSSRLRERRRFLHAIGSRSDTVLREDEVHKWKYDIQQSSRCHIDHLQQRCQRSLSRRISTVCRAYVRCSRQTRIACLVQ